MFGALLAAGALVAAGARVRAVHRPEPPNPAADWEEPPRAARAAAGPPPGRSGRGDRGARRASRLVGRAARAASPPARLARRGRLRWTAMNELPVLQDAPPERADAARNRGKVLAAAERLVAECGASCVSMDAVAKEAGVGKGTLFRRFGDRAGLMQAVLSERERLFQEEHHPRAGPARPGRPTGRAPDRVRPAPAGAPRGLRGAARRRRGRGSALPLPALRLLPHPRLRARARGGARRRLGVPHATSCSPPWARSTSRTCGGCGRWTRPASPPAGPSSPGGCSAGQRQRQLRLGREAG